MGNMSYDILKLKSIDGLDVDYALGRFSDHPSYFRELDEFVEVAEQYLCTYTPAVVIYSEEARTDFLFEVETIRKKLVNLGMTTSVQKLLELKRAVNGNSADELSRGLLTFSTNMSIMAKDISATRIAKPVAKVGDKPIILAVDDKPELLTAIVCMLKADFTVMAVTSGMAALKTLEKHTPSLFLLDIEMPIMDGYQLAKSIREHNNFSHTPIIFLTAKGTRADVLYAIEHGGNDYIVKPVEKSLLINKIRRNLGMD